MAQIPFQAGRLGREEFVQRRDACTRQQLAALQASPEFRRWQQAHAPPRRGPLPWAAGICLALLALGACLVLVNVSSGGSSTAARGGVARLARLPAALVNHSAWKVAQEVRP